MCIRDSGIGCGIGYEQQAWCVDQVDQLLQAHQIDRTVYPIQGLRWQIELAQQEIGQVVGTSGRHFEPHGLAEVALLANHEGEMFGAVVTDIGENGARRLTTALYYTPSGKSIQGKGITPDIKVDQPLPPDLQGKDLTRGESDLKGHIKGVEESDEGSGSAAYVPPDPKDDVQLTAALELLRDRAGEGVMLIGDAGCGKTHLACAAISVGPPGSLFANTTTLLDDVRRGFGGEGQGLFARALSAPLLALDDLGSEAVTDWVRDRLYALINHRWDHCLPLLVTTNVLAADLAERIGQGVTSRIAGCCAHRIRVQGPDGRRRRAET